MTARRIWIGCLALVLLTRTVHCLYVEANLCAHAVATSAEDGQPLSDPNETDPNESGCLCKGALVGTPCMLTALQQQAQQLSATAMPLVPSFLVAAQAAGDPSAEDLLWPPPRSAQMLRALNASWQI